MEEKGMKLEHKQIIEISGKFEKYLRLKKLILTLAYKWVSYHGSLPSKSELEFSEMDGD